MEVTIKPKIADLATRHLNKPFFHIQIRRLQDTHGKVIIDATDIMMFLFGEPHQCVPWDQAVHSILHEHMFGDAPHQRLSLATELSDKVLSGCHAKVLPCLNSSHVIPRNNIVQRLLSVNYSCST